MILPFLFRIQRRRLEQDGSSFTMNFPHSNGEIPMKQWVLLKAESLGVTPSTIYRRISRRTIKPNVTRRENARVIFVRAES